MPYLGYFNSSYVPSDSERMFIAQPSVHLGPNIMSLSLANLFQGIVIVQATNYFAHWWNTDTNYMRAHMIVLFLLSLIHTALLFAQEWLKFVSGFGNWEYLTHISVVARGATLSATLFSLCAQAFFVLRIYHLPWRFDYLFIPLVVFFVGTFGTGIGLVALTPTQITGTAFPDIFHRIDIGSAIFPLFLGIGITIFILAFLGHKSTSSSTTRLHTVLSFTLHSALPATIFLILDLASAFEQPPYALRTLTHSLVGYLQAICVLYALTCRTHPTSPETQATEPGHEMTADLRWTSRVPLLGTSPRLSLLPLHRRAGSNSTFSEQLKRTNTDAARARRVSEADSGYSISFGPPGLHYDPATFKAIYEEPAVDSESRE